MSLKKDIESMVLVVDDDPAYISLWKRILPEIGIMKFIATTNPKEAWKILTSNPCKTLISDIIMPGLCGYELAELARSKNSNCKIILTTGFGADLSRFDLKESNFHILHKPYSNLDELKRFLLHVVTGEESMESFSEDSFSENSDYPQVVEWKL